MCSIPRFDSVLHLSRTEFESQDVAAPLLAEFCSDITQWYPNQWIRAERFSLCDLTGGSSRWYFVEDVIRHTFGEITINRSALPEQTIAKGLSIYFIDPSLLLIQKNNTYQVLPTPPVEDYQPFNELREQITTQPVPETRAQPQITSTDALARSNQSELFKPVRNWGALILFFVFLVDMFVPILGASPLTPEITCCLGIPMWIIALGIARSTDRKNQPRTS